MFYAAQSEIWTTFLIKASESLELNSKVIDHGLNYSNFILSVKLEQWATGVAIMTVISMFPKKKFFEPSNTFPNISKLQRL